MSEPGRQRVAFTVNGEDREAWVFPHESLLDVLRGALGHHEVRYGCGEGVCGTCTVLLDGEPVSGCLLLAVQADGCSLLTVRGLAPGGDLHPLQACFLRNGAAQCGFCTPGMLLTAWALLQRDPRPSRERIRRELVGNLCRCTGYSKILDAVEEHAAEGSGEPRRGAPVGREGSGEPRRGAPVGRPEGGSGEPRRGAPVGPEGAGGDA